MIRVEVTVFSETKVWMTFVSENLYPARLTDNDGPMHKRVDIAVVGKSGQLNSRFPSPPHAPRCAPRQGFWALARRAAPAPKNPVEERSEEESAQEDTRAWHL